ncbi:YihY family inner membrane protein [Agaribacterium haliotis]|uniref:YihY family inner membrane protein n=1 Tax=Agaribacterium haliotis TaxID=2013869 RepID=UPI000BB54E24|nr:YihY family inner membrane protein [Agaribacterium haliotis]
MDHLRPLEKAKLLLRDWLDFFKDLVREFFDQGCQKNAAALTYMTLFALVPMMTVVYSILSVIPFFNGVADQLHGLIFDNFVPETGDQIQQYLTDFSSQARSLTGAGVLMLFVTAYLMLTNIEKTFNGIWGINEARSGLSSFLLYWAVLTIGPLMLGVGLTMSTYLLSVRLLVEGYDPIGVAAALFKLIPIFMSTMMFTLLYAAVPNCRVPLKFALIGGTITALGFELLKLGFAAMVANSSIKLVYGAFAAVPLFLMWVNLLWVLVLGGAVLVRAITEEVHGARRRTLSDMQAVLLCLYLFRQRAQTGASVTDRDCIALGLSLVYWQSLRSTLVKAGWIAVTDSGRYVLSRDLNSLTLKEAARISEMKLAKQAPPLEGDDAWMFDYRQRCAHLRDSVDEQFDVSLEQLFSGHAPADDLPSVIAELDQDSDSSADKNNKAAKREL